MANKTNSTKAPVTPMQALFDAAFNTLKADGILREMFIQAGGDQEGPKRMLQAGRIAFALKCSQEQALIVMDKKGNPGLKSDVGDDVRNILEQKAAGAARTFLSARLKAWGIKTSEARGGDRKGDDTSDQLDTEKLVVPKKVKIETEVELGAYLMAHAKMLYDVFLLNKAHSVVTSDKGSQLMGAVADFCADLADIVGEKEAPRA